jgi:predicted Zn finger-like uncharacterized protein
MNVVCIRCNTKYEFDDALVSSRGTSVKCTNCGHKFRVHPPSGRGEQLPDQWLIRKNSGNPVRFETLRELQKALHEGTVTVTDEISRDGSTYRPIHSVPELESFFPKQGRAPDGGSSGQHTLVGMTSPKAGMPRGLESPRRGGDEEDVTAVYSSEELNKLRPMRSLPPKTGQISQRPLATQANAPRETNPGPGPFAASRSVSKAPIVGTGTAAAGPPPMPMRGTRPGMASSGTAGSPRAGSAVPPLTRTSTSPGVTAKSASPIGAPPAAAPLPGTPTISVTAGPGPAGVAKAAFARPSDVDTVRPPPGMDPNTAHEMPASSPGSVGSFAKQTSLGLSSPPESPKPPPVPVGSAHLNAARVPQTRVTPTLAGVPAPAIYPADAGSTVVVHAPAASSAVPPRAPEVAAGLGTTSLAFGGAPASAPAASSAFHAPAPAPSPVPTAVVPSSIPQAVVPPEAPSHSALRQTASSTHSASAPTEATRPLGVPVQVPVAPVRVPAAIGSGLTPPVPSPIAENESVALPRRGRRDRSDPAPPASAERAATASAFDALDQEPVLVERPRSNVRWVFALLLLAAVVFGGIMLGQAYLKPKPAAVAYDAQVDSLVESGQEAYRRGDFEAARRQFEQASALAGSHPGVLAGQLLLLGTACDRSWLELRLVPPDAPGGDTARTALSQCTQGLKSLSDRAQAVNNGSPELTAVLIDGLRIRGELGDARTRAASLSEHATLPVAAYSLAMLDLADEAPGWGTVLDRLKLASGGERVPGRAQAALVYALARSGDGEAAKNELSKLRAGAPTHPLLAPLEAFLTAPTAESTVAPVASFAPTASAEPSLDAVPSVVGPVPGGPMIDPLEGAREARAKGDHTTAERFYQQALQLNPGNVAALTGLGDVSRARGNTAAALSHYHAALRASAGHLPAISAIADISWANGDKAEAVKFYRRIGPGSVYSIRAQQRIAEFEGQGVSPNPVSPNPVSPNPVSPNPVSPNPVSPDPVPPDAPPSPEDPEETAAPEEEPEPAADEPDDSPPAIPGPAPKDGQ